MCRVLSTPAAGPDGSLASAPPAFSALPGRTFGTFRLAVEEGTDVAASYSNVYAALSR